MHASIFLHGRSLGRILIYHQLDPYLCDLHNLCQQIQHEDLHRLFCVLCNWNSAGFHDSIRKLQRHQVIWALGFALRLLCYERIRCGWATAQKFTWGLIWWVDSTGQGFCCDFIHFRVPLFHFIWKNKVVRSLHVAIGPNLCTQVHSNYCICLRALANDVV